MSRVCEYCGKGSQHGNKVSNSYIHTGSSFHVSNYANSMVNELLWALEGLVEEVKSEK